MWKFALGYVIIQIRGLSLERFLNLMLQAGIESWDVFRSGRTELSLCIRCKDFEKLLKIRRRCRCSVHIVERCGAPFFVARLWRRKVLLFGTLLAFAFICFLSTRILFISISGGRTVDKQGIMQSLEEYGIKRGASNSAFDWRSIGSKLAAGMKEVKWIGFHRRGVYLEVEVQEAVQQQPYTDYSQSSEIIALKGGMITRIDCFRGTAVVKVGDRVEAGDVLLSDTVVYLDFPPYYTHAHGEVYAAMQYSASMEAPRSITELVPSGRTEPYSKVFVAGKEIFEKQCSFESYELFNIQSVEASELILPITVVKGEYHELVEVERELSEDETKQWSMMLAEQGALEQVPDEAEILTKSCYVKDCDGTWVAVCTITTEEKIGVQRETKHE